jgi:hypothetical protein
MALGVVTPPSARSRTRTVTTRQRKHPEDGTDDQQAAAIQAQHCCDGKDDRTHNAGDHAAESHGCGASHELPSRARNRPVTRQVGEADGLPRPDGCQSDEDGQPSGTDAESRFVGILGPEHEGHLTVETGW